MKRFISTLLIALSTHQAFCQVETFDIATYTPLKNWTKTESNGITSYTLINEAAGSFCVVAMYPCSASVGDAQNDFKDGWNDLVVIPHGADTNPKTETQTTPEGWKVVSGAAPIKLDAIDAYAILTVFSGFQKKFCILTTLNDQSYITGVDSFLRAVKLNKTAKVSLVSVTTSETNGTKGQFGSMIYMTPQQWEVKKYKDGDILMPTDIPKGEFLEIWVQPAMNFSGTLEQALQKSYDETIVNMNATTMNDVNGGHYSTVAVKKSFRGWEYIRGSGGIHMGGGDYPPEYGLDLFVIKINNRFERVAVVKLRNNCSYSRYYPADRITYYNAIEQFLFSLQFADWKEPDIKAGIAKGEGITGTWEGISMSVGTPKPGAELGAELKGKQLIFFSNGQAFFGNNFPKEGLDGLNTWIMAENNRRDWGTYSYANGKGVLKLIYADIPLRMENGKLIVTTSQTDHGFIKINAVDGAKFSGTYALSSKNFAGQETGKTPLIRFTAEGKFTDDGAVKILGHEYNECLNIGKDPGSGTYEVKNYSLILNYTDGRKIKIAFMGVDFDKTSLSPATLTISFNGDVLKRQ